jgi:hypothetical protein
MRRATLFTVLSVAVGSFAGCAAMRAEARDDSPAALVASGPVVTDTYVTVREAPDDASRRLPEHVLRDPVQCQAAIQATIMEIVRKTRQVPNDRYQRMVRPQLQRQLDEAGFSRQISEFILADVDQTRATHPAR